MACIHVPARLSAKQSNNIKVLARYTMSKILEMVSSSDGSSSSYLCFRESSKFTTSLIRGRVFNIRCRPLEIGCKMKCRIDVPLLADVVSCIPMLVGKILT